MTQELWRRYSEWPLLGVALVFLVAYSLQVIGNPPAAEAAALETVIWVAWSAFGLDYLVKLLLAEQRGRWFLLNIHELLLLALPVLRPLRLLRLLALVRLLQHTAADALRGRVVIYVLSAAVILTYCGALAGLDSEREAPGANITTFPDALWWSLTTIATVGYGDLYPVTGQGRIVAAALVIGGIAVLSIVTASVASWLIQAVAVEESLEMSPAAKPVQHELARLTLHIQDLAARLSDPAAPPSAPSPPTAPSPNPPDELAGKKDRDGNSRPR